VLDAARGALEDPPAAATFQHHDETWLSGDRVVRGPPLGDPSRPDIERMLDRAVDHEGQVDRLDR